LIKEQLHLTDVQLGLIGASFMWMYALVGPFAGWICDRLPRKQLVLGALIFWSIVTAGISFAHRYKALAICTALGGLGEAFYFPAAMSLISDYHAAGTRSRAMSLHQSGVYAGTIGGGAIAGVIGQHYGWQVSFIFFGAAGILLGIVLWSLLREPVRGMAEAIVTAAAERLTLVESIAGVFRQRVVVLLVLAFIGANFVAVIFLTWMPTFLYQKFHMSLSMAGLSATAYLQMASVPGVFTGGIVADALRKKSAGGRLLTQAIGLLCGVPFLFLTGWTRSVPVLIIAMAGFGYFKGMYDANIFAGLYDVVNVRYRGTAAGILNSMGWLGGGFAPVCIALAAARYGMSICISATAAIYLLVGLTLLAARAAIRKVSK
jgi:MFS family permease